MSGVTLEEVARLANVSRATVSRVVNGDLRVGERARSSVEAAVQQLGYVPNRAARSLVTRRSDSVAVVITEPTGRLFGDPFFPRLLRGISELLSDEALQLVLLMPQGPADEPRLTRYLSAGHSDGVLLVSLHGSDPLPGELQRRGIPVVVAGRPAVAGLTYVDVDNRGGAAAAVRHLLESGRRRVATIAGPQDMAPGADRLAGYRDALEASGRDVDENLIAAGDFTLDGGRAAMGRLLEADSGIDGVFVASDLMALGAMEILRATGRAIPDDVAVVGFDDSPLGESAVPPLSSVRQPIEEMGREMTRLLLGSLRRADAPRRVILDTSLVVRRSSAPM